MTALTESVDLVLKDPGKQFISYFFRDSSDISQFLVHGFMEPLDFDELRNSLDPEQNLKKVVVLDGHPRTGKTWACVAAVATLIDRNGWSPHQWWTGGADSLAVCDMNADLLESAKRIQQELTNRPDLKLVLLDDFIGTNSLRSFGSTSQQQELTRFLQWNAENPWLQALQKGSTLVIVERSMFFTLAEILLKIDIRGSQPNSRDIKIIHKSHGIFRRKEDGRLFGPFSEDLLSNIAQRNSTLHPLKDEGAKWWNKWLVSNAPMVTLGLDSGGKSLWTKLDEEEKNAASWSIFGNDLGSIADELQRLERTSQDESDPILRAKLAAAYLVLLAPALVFLGPTVHKSLGLEERWAEHLQQNLYMSLAVENQGQLILSGRVPNELYMWALREHVEQNFPLLVRACWYVVEQWAPQDRQDIVYGLLMRGILERVLGTDQPFPRLSQILREDKWEKIRQKAKIDPLLAIEGAYGEYHVVEGSNLEPGVAAAVGWLLYRFFHNHSSLREKINEWFKLGIVDLFKSWEESGPEQKEQLWDKLTGSFSPLLQWAIRASKEKLNSEELTKVSDIRHLLADTAAEDRLRMVLEDELIWGHIYAVKDKNSPQNKSAEWTDPVAKQLTEHTFHFLRDAAGEPADTELGRVANRIFSLAWHNEWMPAAAADSREADASCDSAFAKQAKRYFDKFKPLAIEAIRQDPGVLDNNLQYHWIHYVTQHAVWMRQWCFELDPDEYERRRGAPGSPNPKDNTDLVALFGLLLKGNPTKKRARNCLLLIGARAARLPDLSSLIDDMNNIFQHSRESREEVGTGLLQAIFELMRQGYLDGRNVPPIFDDWSRDFTLEKMKDQLETAWADYWDEVNRLSHPFDLLPPRTTGWEQLMPWHWRQANSS